MEEYLQSAKETRITREAGMSGSAGHALASPGYTAQDENHTHYSNETGVDPASRDDEGLAERLEDLIVGVEAGKEKNEQPIPPPKPARLRRGLYQPCTLPLRRDCTNLLPPDQDDDLIKDEETPVSELLQFVLLWSVCYA